MSRFFSFNKRLLDDLRWIRGASHDELHILLRVALDIVKIGPDAESVGQAAHRLRIGVPDALARAQPLSKMLLDVAKDDPTPARLEIALSDLELDDALSRLLVTFCSENKRAVLTSLGSLSLTLPEFKDLHWRLDVEVARRMQHQTVRPTFVMQLDTQSSTGEAERTVMEADIPTLKHVLRELEAAVAESKGAHTQRIRRYIH